MNGPSNVDGVGGSATSKPEAVLGSCHWIPWDSNFIQHGMPDPTRTFSILVLCILFFRFLESHEWDFLLLLKGYFLNPFVVTFFTIAMLIFYQGLVKLSTKRMEQQQQQQQQQQQEGTSKSSLSSSSSLWDAWQSLPVYDRWAAEWYWWNAWLYHGVMDGAAGTFQAVPVVLAQYRVMDLRFSNDHSVPWTIGLVEITAHQVCCWCCLYAILTKSPYRFPMELVTGVLHAFGAVMFVFAEVQEGQFNVPALDPVGIPGHRFGNAKLWDFYHLTYYWFGFWFCNFVWIWVPLYRMQRAMQECVRAFEMAEATKTIQGTSVPPCQANGTAAATTTTKKAQ